MGFVCASKISKRSKVSANSCFFCYGKEGEEENFGKQVNLHFLDSIQLCSIDVIVYGISSEEIRVVSIDSSNEESNFF